MVGKHEFSWSCFRSLGDYYFIYENLNLFSCGLMLTHFLSDVYQVDMDTEDADNDGTSGLRERKPDKIMEPAAEDDAPDGIFGFNSSILVIVYELMR